MSKWSKNLPAARLAALGLVVAVSVACADQADLFGGAGSFSAPHDVAMIGAGCAAGSADQPCLLFVASSDQDELKVLDLTVAPYRWVAAPNPLRPLSIPVLQSPTRLVEDLSYSDGVEHKGPFLYASNPALSEISVVGAAPEQLTELIRLHTPGPVAALSAWGAGTTGSESRLFYAINTGGGGSIYEVVLPLAGLDPAAEPVHTLVLDLPGEYVSAIAVRPRGGQPDLAVATRTAQGRSGRAFVRRLDLNTDQPLNFPYPVRALRADPNPDQVGLRVWGLLDEESCGGQAQCRGLVAVNASTGQVEEDGNLPMLPITHSSGPAVNFDLFPNAKVVATNGAGSSSGSVLGVVTYATGRIGFFHASGGRLRVMDALHSTAPAYGTQLYGDQDGAVLESNPGRPPTEADPHQTHGVTNSSIQFAEGAVRDEQLFMVYQGEVPGLIDVPLDPSAPVPSNFPVDPALLAPCTLPPGADPAAAEVCPRVRVGDSVLLEGGCTEELTVLSVGADVFGASAPAGVCAGATGYTLRAGSTRPFVVLGTVSGYLGRTGTDLTFSAHLPYFYRPDGFMASEPAIKFVMAAPPADIQRDYRYVLPISGGFAPLFITFPQITAGAGRYRNIYPGGVSYLGKGPLMFVSLPAARTLLQVDLNAITANSENAPLEYQ